MRPPRTPPYAGSLVPFGGEARVRAGPFRRGVAGLRRAASCLALARAAEDLGFAVPAALAPADFRLAVVPDLAAVAALPATAFGLAVVFGFTVMPALAVLLALPVVLAFAVLAFADAGFGFAVGLVRADPAAGLAAAGLATDIVFAAAVSALAAVVIALVAVFIACMAMDIVLADEVAFVAAAVILVAAEVTLVAAEDTVRAAAIAVGAALLAAERVVFAAVVLEPVLAFGRAAAPFAAWALVAVPRRTAARVIVFAGTELPPS